MFLQSESSSYYTLCLTKLKTFMFIIFYKIKIVLSFKCEAKGRIYVYI